jgi:hypothetical protein
MVKIERMVTWEKGKSLILTAPSSLGIGVTLVQQLHGVTVQIREVFGLEHTEGIRQKDKAVELTLDKPENITLDQPALGALKNVKTALFIIEDKQVRGLDAHVLVGSEYGSVVYYTGWTGTPEWQDTLLKSAKSLF